MRIFTKHTAILFLMPMVMVILLAYVFRTLGKDVFFYEPMRGDLIFQSLPPNELVTAISGITHSHLSHCGLLTKVEGQWMVIESLGTVHLTPLFTWMRRGSGAGIAVYRLPMTEIQVDQVIRSAQEMLGKPYDLKYDFDDEKIYCSELIYRAFERGMELKIGVLDRLGDLNWRPFEKTILKFEEGPVPVDRLMITPVALTKDPRLSKVFDSF